MASRKITEIRKLVLAATRRAERKRGAIEPAFTGHVRWPINCTVGPGLEGAIACESKIGYVNGTNGCLVYQGYDIFELCAYSTFEEVSYLLLNGRLPTENQLGVFKKKLHEGRRLQHTLRRMMSFPVEDMNPMSALRLGTNFMRQRLSWRDSELWKPDIREAIASDEDSIPMETMPWGEEHAIYEFKRKKLSRPEGVWRRDDALSMDSCIHLIAGLGTLAAAVSRLRNDMLPIEPDPELSHAGNLLYMMTGDRPLPEEERIMDIALILHADHGMNASTFASLVVASTLSDIYLSIGAGISALTGPLHGGANEEALRMFESIGAPANVDEWLDREMKRKRKIPGLGHRVYKTYDPRALILGPLAEHLAVDHPEIQNTFRTARRLEKAFISKFGNKKKIFPNVDFYSGLVYSALGVPVEMFTPMFAVSRVAGWTARVNEYLKKNRIFRPRAMYVGELGKKYIPISKRD